MSAPTFNFKTDSYPSEFIVVSFRGEEKISNLFEYRIDLKVAKATSVDEATMINEKAVFTFVSHINSIQDVEIKGIISAIDYKTTGANHNHYRATLVPEAWNETLGVDYEIFLKMTPRQIVDEEIADANIEAVTSAVSIAHKERPFTCQYNESNFAFISRIAEHYGMYYYFDHSADSKIVFADDNHYPACDSPQIEFDTTAAGNSFFNRINRFRKKTRKMAAQVIVSGSNPDQPSATIIARAGDTSASTGDTLRLVEEDVIDSDEAQKIADIRYEEILTKSTTCAGKSGAIQLRPGFTFDLSGHPLDGSNGGADFNDTYLVTKIIHEGNNLDQAYSGDPNDFYYRNSFQAINSSIQFRPGKITAKPRATSCTGRVFSEAGNPRLAERNEKGEYRVRFDFLDDEIKAKASSWLRMATPAAGTEDTMDIPLKGGVEVNISFTNGNPDKPFIQNAIPNAQFPAQVTESNLHHALIGTDGLLALKSSGGFHLNVKTEQDTVRDSVNDFNFPIFNATTNVLDTPMSIETEMSGDYLVERAYGDEYEYRHGNSFRYLNNESEYVIGTGYLEQHVNDASGVLITYNNIASTTLGSWDVPAAFKTNNSVPGLVEKTWGDKYDYHNGTTRAWSECKDSPNGGGRSINYGTGFTLNFLNESPGEVVMNPVHTIDPAAELKAAEEKQEQSQSFFGKVTTFLYMDALGDLLNGWLMGIFDSGVKDSISDAFKKGEKIIPAGSTEKHFYQDITKTVGNTYDYHNGDELNVHSGETIDIVYGDTKSLTVGHTFDHFNGESSWYFNGGHEEFIMGGAKSTHVGYKTDNFVGGLEEMVLGAHLEIELSAGKELSSTSKSRLENKKNKIAADEAAAAIKYRQEAVSIMINSLKNDVKALSQKIDAINVNVTVTNYNITAVQYNVMAAFIKIG